VVSLKEPWVQATADPALRELLLSIAFWGAAQERRRISERTKAGMRAAKAAGKQLGRPKGSGRPWALAKRKVDVVLARSLQAQGVAIKDIAERFHVSRVAIYLALRA
jgi:DNA invertase Pin-like site-specific DNA recombinase